MIHSKDLHQHLLCGRLRPGLLSFRDQYQPAMRTERADCSLPGSSVHGILQARTLEWVAMPSSRDPTQGSNLCFLHWQADSLLLAPPETPIPIHTQVQKGSSNLLVASSLPSASHCVAGRIAHAVDTCKQMVWKHSEDREARVSLEAERSKFEFRSITLSCVTWSE